MMHPAHARHCFTTRQRPSTIFLKLAFCLFINCAISACSTLENGRGWGQDASFTPSAERLRSAFFSAAGHPASWSPLLGVAVLSVGDLDEELSDQLAKDTPLFGSNEDAGDASDFFRDSLVGSVVISALALPAGQDGKQHLINKSKGLLTEIVALKATGWITSGIKDATGRQRPNRANNKSFPSGHSSRAFAAAALSSKNLDSLSMSDETKTGIRIGLYSFASATAWARVEANVHYPADVLAGAALGNFLSRFIHDAFLGLEHENKYLQIEILPKETLLSLHWAFF